MTGSGVAKAEEDARGVGVAAERFERDGEGLEERRVAGPFRERGGEGGGGLVVALGDGAEEAEAALLFGDEAAQGAQIEEGLDGLVALAGGLVEIGELGLELGVLRGELGGAEEGGDGLVAEVALGAGEAQGRRRRGGARARGDWRSRPCGKRRPPRGHSRPRCRGGRGGATIRRARRAP